MNAVHAASSTEPWRHKSGDMSYLNPDATLRIDERDAPYLLLLAVAVLSLLAIATKK